MSLNIIEYGSSSAGSSPSTHSVASQAAMLALNAAQGDYAVRSDTSQTFVLSAADPTVLANWTLIGITATPATEPTSTTRITKTIQADPGTTTLALSNTTIPSTSFTQQDAVSNTRGTYVRYMSGGSAGSFATIYNMASCRFDTLPDASTTFEIYSPSAGARYLIGLSSLSTESIGTNGVDGQAHLAFIYDSGVDTTWRFQSNAGNDGIGGFTERQTVNTGVAFAALTRVTFRVKVVSTSLVEGYINGTKVGELTSQLPLASQTLRGTLNVTNIVADNRAILFSKYHVQHN